MSGSKVSVCIPILLKSAVDVCPNTDVSIPTVPPILTLLRVEIPVAALRLVSITGGKVIDPVKVTLPSTSRLPPTPRSLVIVDVPTTSRLKSGFVLPTPTLPSCVNDNSSALLCPYIHPGDDP